MSDNLFAFPCGGQRDSSAIAAHVVVFYGHLWRVVLEMSAPCKAHVEVNGVAIAVQFPVAGYGHVAPSRVVKVGFVKACGTLVGIFHPIKFPIAMQRQVVFRAFGVAHLRLLSVFKGEEVGVHGHPVQGVHLQAVPFGERRLGRDAASGHCLFGDAFYIAPCCRTFRLALRCCLGLCLQAEDSQCRPKENFLHVVKDCC